MKCFYHSSDLDGKASGAIVKMRHPSCELVGINYGDPFPWDSIAPGEEVFMVDFCLQPFEDMVRLNSHAKLYWFDHHKTAIEEMLAVQFKASGESHLAIDKAGCELTWEYCFRGKPLPRAVYYLGRYDIWQHEHVPGALEFQYGMRFEKDTRPTNQKFWMDICTHQLLVDKCVKLGGILLEYEKRQNEKYAKSCAFDVVLDGLRCIAINKGLTGSLLFQSVYNPEIHDAMLSFVRRNGKWNIAMYAVKPDVDVSAICKARGGGGHKGAAGFSCETLPF